MRCSQSNPARSAPPAPTQRTDACVQARQGYPVNSLTGGWYTLLYRTILKAFAHTNLLPDPCVDISHSTGDASAGADATQGRSDLSSLHSRTMHLRSACALSYISIRCPPLTRSTVAGGGGERRLSLSQHAARVLRQQHASLTGGQAPHLLRLPIPSHCLATTGPRRGSPAALRVATGTCWSPAASLDGVAGSGRVHGRVRGGGAREHRRGG